MRMAYESEHQPRRPIWPIQGESINNLALEKCHLDYDICYAVDLLMGSLQTDQLSEAERLMLALRILNGEVEIRGTYPSDNYGPVELETRNEQYDLRSTLTTMKQMLSDKERENQRLLKMLACCGEQLENRGMQKVNRAWINEWGEKGKVFSEAENSELDPVSSKMVNELLERIERPDSDQDYGWLEPSGVFHPVEWGEHEEWAHEQIKLRGWFDELTALKISSASLCGDFLVFRRGWVLLHNPAHGLARPIISDTKPLTKAQREFLFDYYTERGWPVIAKGYLEEG